MSRTVTFEMATWAKIWELGKGATSMDVNDILKRAVELAWREARQPVTVPNEARLPDISDKLAALRAERKELSALARRTKAQKEQARDLDLRIEAVEKQLAVALKPMTGAAA